MMTMVKRIIWRGSNVVCGCCRNRWIKCKVTFLSLFYNEHCDFSYVVDTMMEPMIWFVDNYVKYLGPAFVGFLIGMMGMVIVLTYAIIVPYEWLRKSYFEIGFYLVVGHWILISVIFHYYCAYTTKPGAPPVGTVLLEAVSMCKHCVAPKPPRTHHCRICNRCILKMDHHCPWLNQCVGHYNHRYFFFTMFFMWWGCFFIVFGMWPCFVEHYWIELEQAPVAPWCLKLNQTVFYAGYMCQGEIDYDFEIDTAEESEEAILESDIDQVAATEPMQLVIGGAVQKCVLFVFFTSAAVVVAVGALMVWHMRLIIRGETSIEQHINKQTKNRFAKEGKVYVNPYNFGWRGNVKRFLGLNALGRSFWRHVLLPSRHLPVGDGLTWESATFEIRHQNSLDNVNAIKWKEIKK